VDNFVQRLFCLGFSCAKITSQLPQNGLGKGA
jgi:hypothetical protein